MEPRQLLHGGDGIDHYVGDGHGHSSACACACCSQGGLFVDGILEDQTGTGDSTSDDTNPEEAPSFSEAFSLNSNAGAKHTIYLDFDGHTFSNTIWNYGRDASITADAFNMSGGSDFTSSELDRIYNIWQRVAEDFMPFDVNVTTEDPGEAALKKSGSGDDAWGVRVVIGGSYSDWYGSSAGGVAYVGSFNWSTDTPTFVFSDSLGDNEKYVAEAASHEAGHTLGLSHDGTSSSGYYTGHGSGDNGWAPILGAGYYKNLTQWSKGEYANASQSQDDLSILTSNNGFGYRTDDFGGSLGSAHALTASSNSISVSGIIEKNTDLDFFSFTTGAGQVNLTFDVAERGANLDILAKLYNASGDLVATGNTAGELGASISTTLAAGTYYVSIDGTGEGDVNGTGYSDYGSLGQYTMTGTVQAAGTAVTPDITVNNISINENGTATFTISLSEATTQTVTVRAYTQDGTAKAGSDYTAFDQTISFAAGETTKQVTVTLINDQAVESSESFQLKLTSATNGNITDSSGTATIGNDDVAKFSIGNATVNESDGTATFTISLDRASNQTTTVRVYTQNGTALSGSDYTSINQTVTFAAGETTKQVTVSILNDTAVESNENFFVKLTSATGGASIADNSGTITITNDDVAPPPQEPETQEPETPDPNTQDPSAPDSGTGSGTGGTTTNPKVSVYNKRGKETARKGIMRFKIKLSGASDQIVKVRFETLSGSGTAIAGEDYQTVSKQIRFKPGQTIKRGKVKLVNDSLQERNEKFFVQISNAKGAEIERQQAKGVIVEKRANAALPTMPWRLAPESTTLALTSNQDNDLLGNRAA